jgi:GNAT superfamily N-acetyltransferase
MDPESTRRVIDMWRSFATSETAFENEGVVVVAADDHRLSPRGWVGVVVLGDAAVVATPRRLVERVETALASVSDLASLTSPESISASFGTLVGSRGPALLLYGDVAPPSSGAVVGPLAVTDRRVEEVLAGAATEEREESGLALVDSGVFVASDGGRAVSASGWRIWPAGIAHMSVLTASTHRGLGYGLAAASAALQRASTSGLVFQWRAAETNAASIALGTKLGLAVLGRQFSFCFDS